IIAAVGLAIMFTAMIVTSTVNLSGFGVGLGLIAWFLMSWFYGGLFETFWNGQTPGKRCLGIRAIGVNGQPITGFQAVLRTVLRSVDAMPTLALFPFHLVGLISAASTARF